MQVSSFEVFFFIDQISCDYFHGIYSIVSLTWQVTTPGWKAFLVCPSLTRQYLFCPSRATSLCQAWEAEGLYI